MRVGSQGHDWRYPQAFEDYPFIPFSVRTADGHEYLVPTIDHIYLPPTGRRVVISDDEGVVVVLPGLLISGLAPNFA